MKIMSKMFVALLAIPLLFFVTNCGSSLNVRAGYTVGGFVYDAATAKKLTKYTMTITTAAGILTGDSAKSQAGGDVVIASDGFFQAKIPYQTAYTVEIKADGYDAFVSTNAGLVNTEWNAAAAGGNGAATAPDPASFIANAMLTPTAGGTLSTVITYNAKDNVSQAAIKGAKLVNTGVTAGVFSVATYTSSGIASSLTWTPDSILAGIASITGTDAGVIAIPTNTLKYGYTYTFRITADGYDPSALQTLTTLAIGANAPEATTGGKDVSLTKIGSGTIGHTFALVSTNSITQSTVDGRWTNAAQKADKVTLTFTFNNDIEIDTVGVRNNAFENLVSLMRHNSNGNATVEGYTADATVFSATTLISGYLTISASTNTLTIVLNPTVTTVDTGDTVVYNYTTLAGLVNVKGVGYSNTFNTLASYTLAYKGAVPGGYTSNAANWGLAAFSAGTASNVLTDYAVVYQNRP